MQLSADQPKPRAGVAGLLSLLSGWAIRRPIRALVVVALLTLAAAPGAVRLKLRTDGQALLSPNAPEVIYDRAVRDQFGIEDQVVVLIRSWHPDGIFNAGTLRLVREMTAEFQRLPEIGQASVMSLATELSFRFRSGTYLNRRLLEPALTNKVELDELRDDLRRIELYTGTLVSADGKSTAILVGVPPGCERTQFYESVLATIAARRPGMEDISVTGAPVAEALLGLHILEDLGVPQGWLGTSTRTEREKSEWKLPHNLRDLRLLVARRVGLVPLAVLVMMLVFYLSFRNAPAMLLPLPGVAATLVFVFGSMGWLGVPVYLTIAVMPVLLAATGVTNDIYLFSRYFGLLRQRPGVRPAELVEETFDKLARPVAATSLTAGIGFLSFGFSPLGPVRAFGIWSCIGVLFGLFCSFTLVPALLTLVPPGWLVPAGRRQRSAPFSALAPGFVHLGLAVRRWRWWMVGLTLVVGGITPLGLRRLAVQDSWIESFDPGSEFRCATTLVNEQFYGMHLLLVSFNAPQTLAGEAAPSAFTQGAIIVATNLIEDPMLIHLSPITICLASNSPAGGQTHAPANRSWRSHIATAGWRSGDIIARINPQDAPTNFWNELSQPGQVRFEIAVRSHLRPEIIRAVADLGTFVRERRQDAVGGVLDPADYLLTTQFMLGPNDPQARRLPRRPNEINLLWNYYRTARGQQRFRQLLDTNYWQSLTTVFLKDGNFVATARLMSAIRAYEREHLAPKGIKLGFAGDVALSQSLIRGIVTTQLQSLLCSLAGILAVTAFFGGSLRWGVYCLLPSLLAVVIKFAVMGWLGVGLGVATSMFAAMTLGIGVNCAIHLLEGCRQAQAAGAAPGVALSQAMALTGPPALINTVAMSLGFGVLMLSQVPANARLGLLLVLGLVNCLVMSLLLLPVLLHWWPLKQPSQR
jgi:uncharacterized protein